MEITSNLWQFYIKSIIVRVKTILLAQTWISVTVIAYILQKQSLCLYKMIMNYLSSPFLCCLFSLY